MRIERTPALSPDGSKICFTYQGNLWIVPVTGGVSTRLTANDSFDLNSRWSPDGKWIAFNSNREGGNQIFVIPSQGGPARQITFHSSPTTVCDWFPDGKSLLVVDTRETLDPSIFRLDLASGRRKLLVTDHVKSIQPSLSPDGRWIAYVRGALVDIVRKNYKGSANYDIYVAPTDGSAPPKRLTSSDRNDMWPAFGADNKTVFYCSEREGVMSVWRQGRDGGSPARVVNSPPDATRNLSISRNGSMLAYECNNNLCVTPASGGAATALAVYCRTDERGSGVSRATFERTGASEFALSKDGKRIAFVERGDIFVVNAERGGEAKRVTDNPSRDWQVTWTPDGKQLVFASNRSGLFKLYTVTLATLETRQLSSGSGNDQFPQISPDGKWVAYNRSPQTSLRLIRLDGSGDHEAVAGPNVQGHSWSPDGRWLTYFKEDDIRVNDLWVIPVGEDGTAGKPSNVTDHPGINLNPLWFPDGGRLAFLSNRYRNRDIETINHTGRFLVYTLALQKEPEKFEPDEDVLATPPVKETKKLEVKIDFDEIDRRAKPLVNFEEACTAISVSPDSKTIVFVGTSLGQPDLWQVSVEGGALQRLTTSGESPLSMSWAPDSSKFYYVGAGGSIKVLPRGGGPASAVPFTVHMDVDRLVDYYAVFDEAWQTMNDTYYDPKFHGADWQAVRAKYRALVPEVAVRQDFVYLITQMLGELNSSHTGYSSVATLRPARPTGYLGVLGDDGYVGPGVRIASVLRRGPASKAESLLRPGEYIMAIDGKSVALGTSYDQALTDRVGRGVTLLVNSAPSTEGARKVSIKPVSARAWIGLLYEKMVDDRRAMADKLSNGRVGYLHVADMTDPTRDRFERELYSIGHRKEAMVLDFRGNNGGDTHDSLLKMLSRTKYYFEFSPRTEAPFGQPERAVVRPIIVLIDEASLSDAEVFANGFREYKLGKMVGKPTMGWIIFTSGQELLDGSFLRTPATACLTNDGRDMELWGVPPDIDVDFTPADFRAGRDPQLERAVQEILKDPRIKR